MFTKGQEEGGGDEAGVKLELVQPHPFCVQPRATHTHKKTPPLHSEPRHRQTISEL